jgi:hypothetical protein
MPYRIPRSTISEVDLYHFIQQYTDAVYHERNPEAADRFIADPCIRHEHGHQIVMSLAENKARIAAALAAASDLRFEYAAEVANGEFYAAAYQFTMTTNGNAVTRSGLEIFRIRDGLIVETWNSLTGEGPWG